MNKDVREALRNLEHAIDRAQDEAADTAKMNIYGALWTDMANATARCASDLEHKKVAPGADNTESGSKEGRPKRDDSLTHNQSVDEKVADVKRDNGAYIIARHVGDDIGSFEASGAPMKLAVCCAATISELAERIPKKFVVAAILSGCDHAGISMEELIGTYMGAHGHV